VSYGVNRSKKKTTTRRRVSRASTGRARSAAKSKRAGTRTKSGGRARSTAKVAAKKRSTTRSTKKKKSAPRKKPSAKKARLYTRYDPTTGQKVRVTSDTFEYQQWPSRKPSKKKIAREALKTDPVGTLGMLGATAGKRAAERAGERAVSTALRSGRGAIATTVLGTASSLAASSTAVALAAAGAVGAAIFAMGEIAKRYDVALGERANQISRQFVVTQQQVIKQYGGSRWEDVPLDIRTKLVNGYKAAIAKVYSGVHTGVFAPSQQIPYGR